MKILIVFGTRPEAIKMAPLVKRLKLEQLLDVKVCVTAQHRSMLDQVLSLFDIKPDFDLNIMRPGQDLTDVTSSVMLGMRKVFNEWRPDYVFVHGDTTTAMATAVSAFYSGIKIAHVEAGLRTFDITKPFPEEFNRQAIGLVSDLNFCPTESSNANLQLTHGLKGDCHITGNTVIDALLATINSINEDAKERDSLISDLSRLVEFDIDREKFVLITGHRRENFGDGFINICKAIRSLALSFPDVFFVYPVHLNPNVQAPVNELLSGITNVKLVAPQEYKPFVMLLNLCHLVLTDSGGVQEEAPSFGKPVLVMRDVTERPEAVTAGTVKLVGADDKSIVSGVTELLQDTQIYNEMARAINPYGDGTACDKIANIMLEKVKSI